MYVEMKNISKSFGTNQVLRDVTIMLKSGEIHALMGENGAGKSTLMNILTGLHKKDAGTILIDGQEKTFSGPKEAEEFGISFIHQEMNSWPQMTVLENLFLNNELKKPFGLLDTKKMREVALHHFNQLGIFLDLDKELEELSVGQQQMIEITKALMTDAKILIMDEPTAALSDTEIKALFKIIHQLKARDVAIVYISHRMEEIFQISDVITVMRDGLSIDTSKTSETDVNEVVRKMVGREISDYYPKKTALIGDVVFTADHLTGANGAFKDISFKVRSGEIVGFSGLMGAGRTEIMRGIFGLDPLRAGTITIEGEEKKIESPAKSIQNGIGFLTEDRKSEGLVLDFSVLDNITLPSIDGFIKNGLVDKKTEAEFAELLIQRLLIKVQSENDIVGDLSGGNQQKVVLAKWIGAGPKVLILDEPTRGVDVGAKREIYQLMNELADRGVGIIVVSSDLPEVMGVSDRIVVVHEGKINGELQKEDFDQEKIMTYATGGK
ncbi:ribose import ATP-binding protein RbsA [Enterococcus saigonensis]|uniref:Ribose import ATP-binding protein RbsA n=1 Tax=Enterococcus saigonensis TaxID=1805431 RepID=A0A679IN34_9ENTE|nr:sugar ABC transporter ATP-binding protein [Enterococcus saigonensis]BCA86231.1 ribose import ATP-binding protein RbsA [Enterococcus saigonensis]